MIMIYSTFLLQLLSKHAFAYEISVNLSGCILALRVIMGYCKRYKRDWVNVTSIGFVHILNMAIRRSFIVHIPPGHSERKYPKNK